MTQGGDSEDSSFLPPGAGPGRVPSPASSADQAGAPEGNLPSGADQSSAQTDPTELPISSPQPRSTGQGQIARSSPTTGVPPRWKAWFGINTLLRGLRYLFKPFSVSRSAGAKSDLDAGQSTLKGANPDVDAERTEEVRPGLRRGHRNEPRVLFDLMRENAILREQLEALKANWKVTGKDNELKIVNHKLEQMGTRTRTLNVLARSLMLIIALAGMGLVALVIHALCQILSAQVDEHVTLLALQAHGVVGGFLSFVLVGGLLLLGRLSHPPEDKENPWERFPTALTELMGQVAQAVKEKKIG